MQQESLKNIEKLQSFEIQLSEKSALYSNLIKQTEELLTHSGFRDVEDALGELKTRQSKIDQLE